MTDDTTDTERTDDESTTNENAGDANEADERPTTGVDAHTATGADGSDDRISLRSRRSVLKASAAVGAGGLALGLGNSATAAKVQESCDTNYAKIEVANGFKLMDNQWSMSNPQCIWLNDDDSYGYDFDASGYSGGPNYPEVFIGTRPWGDDTGVAEFPVQRGNVDELVMEVDADYTHSGGEWDWAEEWWLMEEPPSQQTETHKYEVMLLLDWSADHDHGAVTTENAWTDRFGNTVDHWTTYNSGGTSATFYIFRIQGGYAGGKVDMKEIVDYLTATEGIREDLWLSGIELGNEYWGGAVGETTYNTFDVSVNGSTYTSGSSGGGGSTETPTATETQTSTETETETPAGDSLVVNDYDGDPAWPGSNDLGQWCGAGSFQNDDGAVVSGALRLDYASGGWFKEQINRDVSGYSTVNLRVRGDGGGEESDFSLSLGGVEDTLANVTSDSIGTSFSTVSVDMAANGIDASNPGTFYLDFWSGASADSAIEIDRIWFA